LSWMSIFAETVTVSVIGVTVGYYGIVV